MAGMPVWGPLLGHPRWAVSDPLSYRVFVAVRVSKIRGPCVNAGIHVNTGSTKTMAIPAKYYAIFRAARQIQGVKVIFNVVNIE